MTTVMWISGGVAAVVHVLAFAWETLLFNRPGVHRDIFRIPTTDLPPVRLWSFNVGFYNLFLAAGMVFGIVAWMRGDVATGRPMVLYVSVFMLLAGVALFVSDRMALSRPRGAGVGGSLAQAVPPLVVLIAAVL